MKILFVTRGFPSEKNPMVGNYEAVQAQAIAAKGHEVSVIGIEWKNLFHVFKSHKVRHRVVNGINVYESSKIKIAIPHVYFPKIEQKVRQWQFKKVFCMYVSEMGMPDVVHAHIVRFAAPAIFIKKEFNIPFVITEHWSAFNMERTPKRIFLESFAYNYADRVVCVSEVLSNNIKKKCNVDSLIINNMVSDLFFQGEKSGHHGGSFRFISVGAFRKDKRFDFLVEAFSQCKFPNNVYLDIVGDGGERSLIEKVIKDYGMEDQVKLLGMKEPKVVNELLRKSDCFVLSSRSETFSIVLIEAMAKGLPVIATRCGGPESFVRKEDGLLVPKEKVEDLAKAMRYMVSHYQEYNSKEIRQHCYDSFSQDVVANKIIDVYQDVVSNRKG